jgi:hypothetical protein
MNEDTLNLEIRRVLKKFGISAQREIEHAVTAALASGKLKGNETLTVRIQLALSDIALQHVVEDTVRLE